MDEEAVFCFPGLAGRIEVRREGEIVVLSIQGHFNVSTAYYHHETMREAFEAIERFGGECPLLVQLQTTYFDSEGFKALIPLLDKKIETRIAFCCHNDDSRRELQMFARAAGRGGLVNILPTKEEAIGALLQ